MPVRSVTWNFKSSQLIATEANLSEIAGPGSFQVVQNPENHRNESGGESVDSLPALWVFAGGSDVRCLGADRRGTTGGQFRVGRQFDGIRRVSTTASPDHACQTD